jgi:cell division septation protein DedD
LRRLILLALVGAACSGEKPAPDSTTTTTVEARGADPLLLRVPRGGGLGRVYLYPKLDSVIWTLDEAPALSQVLAFDPNNGTIAYVDSKGFPGRIDLRETDVGRATKTKLTSLTSANGSDIYGINAKGEVIRLNPSGGDWKFEPPVPARGVIAEPNGDLIIAANKGAQTLLWKVRPPDQDVQDSAMLPLTGRGIRTQVGDRLYFTVDSGLVGVKARDLSPVGAVKLDTRVHAMAPTPSGDRLYIATENQQAISVIDRYSDSGAKIELPQTPEELRMDPLGRYLLARFPNQDSAWVIAIGTNRLVGAVATRWVDDLPSVTPDGHLALLGEKDVTINDAEKLTVRSTMTGGAKDFWYFFSWDGFRPRAQGLDQPVTFPSDSQPVDSTASSTIPVPSPSAPLINPRVDSSVSGAAPIGGQATTGFTVQFAALLSEETARALASAITINGIQAHIVSTTAAGSPIYRVVMGPFATREEAARIGRASRREYWIYEGSP